MLSKGLELRLSDLKLNYQNEPSKTLSHSVKNFESEMNLLV